MTAQGSGVMEAARSLGRKAKRRGHWTRQAARHPPGSSGGNGQMTAEHAARLPVRHRGHAASPGARALAAGPPVFRPRVALTDACIAAHPQTWPVAGRCDVLGGGRRGLSADQRRQAGSSRRGEASDVLARIPAMAQQTNPRDGRRRMRQQLQEEGDAVGRWSARRLLTPAGVSVAGRRRRRPKPPERRPGSGGAPHLLDRHGAVMAPHVAGGGEGTDLWTEEGGWYTSGRVARYASQVGGGDARASGDAGGAPGAGEGAGSSPARGGPDTPKCSWVSVCQSGRPRDVVGPWSGGQQEWPGGWLRPCGRGAVFGQPEARAHGAAFFSDAARRP